MQILTNLIDFILHVDVHLNALVVQYDTWVYVILFLIIFCETGLVVTPFLPGDSLLFITGTITANTNNSLDVFLMILLLSSAAILGNTSNYTIGRLFGERLFNRPNSRIFKAEYLQKTHQFFEKHGGKTIILTRFIPILRTFAPFVAGMSKMTYLKFFTYNIIGGISWIVIFIYTGFLFGEIEIIKNHLNIVMLLIVIISILPILFEFGRNLTKKSVAKN